MGSCISESLSIIIQDKLLVEYNSQLCASALIVTMSSIQCGALAAAIDRDIQLWRFAFTFKGAAILFSAIIGSAIFTILTLWCIRKKGPVFVSMFSPTSLFIVGIFSPLVLDEQLHLGTLLGVGVISLGICLMSWGKKDDTNQNQAAASSESPQQEEAQQQEAPGSEPTAISAVVMELRNMVLGEILEAEVNPTDQDIARLEETNDQDIGHSVFCF